jgi:hypothetical protein
MRPWRVNLAVLREVAGSNFPKAIASKLFLSVSAIGRRCPVPRNTGTRDLELLVSEWAWYAGRRPRVRANQVFALKDTWRTMSARHDDHSDFRNDLISASILLSARYRLED